MNDSDDSIRNAVVKNGHIEANRQPSPFPAAPTSLAKSYLPKVRACHDLAGVLKRTRPTVQRQVIELEGIVTRAHQLLGDDKTKPGAADARGNIDGAYHALLALRRAGS